MHTKSDSFGFFSVLTIESYWFIQSRLPLFAVNIIAYRCYAINKYLCKFLVKRNNRFCNAAHFFLFFVRLPTKARRCCSLPTKLWQNIICQFVALVLYELRCIYTHFGEKINCMSAPFRRHSIIFRFSLLACRLLSFYYCEFFPVKLRMIY